jgi:phosphoglycolate phosphatase-like HAD superfamily hydrolase
MSLADVRHWVFDMDGTLTVAVHDFAAIRVALAIPRTTSSPTSPRCRPTKRRPSMPGCWSMSANWRWARRRPGAVELVRELAGRGYRLGILTRNARSWRM